MSNVEDTQTSGNLNGTLRAILFPKMVGHRGSDTVDERVSRSN